MSGMNTALPRLMLAAPASGSGKTTMTIALLRALQNRGISPAAFKCGPDYIDPMFHRDVLGMPGYNLDLFFTPPSIARGLLAAKSANVDIAILEGVMGYYDGAGMTEQASSWHLARETDTPTVLVLRPKGASLSVAAWIKGFMEFREHSQIRGVLLNGVKETMAEFLTRLIERECGIRVYGFLPDMLEAKIRSRHLGLVMPEQVDGLQEIVDAMGRQCAASVDIEGLLALARTAPNFDGVLPDMPNVAKGVTVAVARDAAFCFYYQENLDLLVEMGAKLSVFSPINDAKLPPDTGGLYIGGGYPELHAQTLSVNKALIQEIREAAESGMPIIAECGGFLYLGESMEDVEGEMHTMVGLLPGKGTDQGKLNRFGYITLTANEDNLLCQRGESLRGHEFHHWDSDCNGKSFTAQKPFSQKEWSCVQGNKNLYAGFPHLYFWSNPQSVANFVKAASKYANSKGLADS